MTFRNSHSQVFYRISVLKHFANLAYETTYSQSFLVKMQAYNVEKNIWTKLMQLSKI